VSIFSRHGSFLKVVSFHCIKIFAGLRDYHKISFYMAYMVDNSIFKNIILFPIIYTLVYQQLLDKLYLDNSKNLK